MGIIKAKFNAEFESVEKNAKQFIYKKLMAENFCTKVKKSIFLPFFAETFLRPVFCNFLKDSKSSSNSAFFDTYLAF